LRAPGIGPFLLPLSLEGRGQGEGETMERRGNLYHGIRMTISLNIDLFFRVFLLGPERGYWSIT